MGLAALGVALFATVFALGALRVGVVVVCGALAAKAKCVGLCARTPLFGANLLRIHRGRHVPVFLLHYGCNEIGERVEWSAAMVLGCAVWAVRAVRAVRGDPLMK